jgi:hypothetical protein
MAKEEVKRQREILAATYGLHVPLRMQMESEILSQYRRLPTLQSSMVGLDTLAGRDTQINISDVFGAIPRVSAAPRASLAVRCAVCAPVVCSVRLRLTRGRVLWPVQTSRTRRTHRRSICTTPWRSSSD